MKPTITVDTQRTGTLQSTEVHDITAPLLESAPTVPGYELLGILGRGGMGVVYRARDIGLQREVAVKVLQNVSVPGSAAAERFLEEARIMGQLQHPGIPAVHQAGTLADGRPFLAMKLIKGDTLDVLLKSGKVNYLPIFETVCQAVGYAHVHGVIHRDLKPSNIMVGAFGEVQVLDWGLAKVLSVDPSHQHQRPDATVPTEIRSLRDANFTQAGSIMGTPAYMAPEQAAGQVSKIDQRADVFGLGAILCVMLTGRPPFAGADCNSVRINALRGDTKAAIGMLDGCGSEPALVALCKSCLSFDPNERPADASAVAQAVASLRAAADERAKAAEREQMRSEVRTAEQRKRRKVQLALAITVALLLLGGGAFAWWQLKQESKRRAEAARLDHERIWQEETRMSNRLMDAKKLRQEFQFARADEQLAELEKWTEGFDSRRARLIDGPSKSRFEREWSDFGRMIERERQTLTFVAQLDRIRFRKWLWIAEAGGKGGFNFRFVASEYRKAFAECGIDLLTLEPAAAVQAFWPVIEYSSDGFAIVPEADNPSLLNAAKPNKALPWHLLKANIVAAVDDWALYEPDEAVRNRLLEFVRRADPFPWRDRLRDPAVRQDKKALEKLAGAEAAMLMPSSTLVVLATLMERCGLDPSKLLATVSAQRSRDFELIFALGIWHMSNIKDGQEINLFAEALRIRPDNIAVTNNLWVAYQRNGEHYLPDDVLRLVRTAQSAEVLNNYGIMLIDHLNEQEAIATLSEAIELEPRLAQPQSNLGWVYFRLKRHAKAIACAQMAIAVDPNYAAAHELLGHLLRETGNMEGSLAAFAKAAGLDPKRWQTAVVQSAQIEILPPPREVKP